MKKQLILEGIVSLLVMMFLYASFSKYFDFAAFQRAMYRQPFPHGFSTLLIIVMPPIEIMVSILLITEKKRTQGLRAAVILMTLFTGYISAILLHLFPKVPCSCGGVIARLNWQQHLLVNCCFLLLAITGLIIQQKSYDAKDGSSRP
jgi:uncharacterized membrane protein YphA (DoxX/SURF4 family)